MWKVFSSFTNFILCCLHNKPSNTYTIREHTSLEINSLRFHFVDIASTVSSDCIDRLLNVVGCYSMMEDFVGKQAVGQSLISIHSMVAVHLKQILRENKKKGFKQRSRKEKKKSRTRLSTFLRKNSKDQSNRVSKLVKVINSQTFHNLSYHLCFFLYLWKPSVWFIVTIFFQAEH